MGAGTKLKKLLRKKNVSVKELAKKGNISLNTLYSITKRDPKHISKELCEKIARALDMELQEVNNQINFDYFISFFTDDKDKPELLDLYDEIRNRQEMYILFDKVRDLDPNDIENIINIVQTIRKAKGIKE